MKEIFLKYGSFLIIIIINLFYSYWSEEKIIWLLFTFTIILLIYFLVPLVNRPIINYLLIIVVFTITTYLMNGEIYYLLLFPAFFLIEGAYNLKGNDFYVLSSSYITVLIVLTVIQKVPLYHFMFFVIFIIGSIYLNHCLNEVKEKNKLYEQLLIQYRKLKRISVEQEELARSEERTKIARDMHDSVGHKLTALLMQLEVLNLQHDDTEISHVKQLARESLEETRHAVRQLKVNETSGIQSVIQLIRKLEIESRLIIRFTLEKGVLSLPLTNRQSVVLYRVLQECLTNAMKHSESKEVDVTLSLNSLQHVQYSVKNKVFSNYPIIQGFGLTNMKERLQEIGGDLRIIKSEQQFVVEGSFPLREDVS